MGARQTEVGRGLQARRESLIANEEDVQDEEDEDPEHDEYDRVAQVKVSIAAQPRLPAARGDAGGTTGALGVESRVAVHAQRAARGPEDLSVVVVLIATHDGVELAGGDTLGVLWQLSGVDRGRGW